MQVKITSKIAPLRRVNKRITEQATQPQQMLNAVGRIIVNRSRLLFAAQQSPDGKKWTPLKNPSAARGGASAKALQHTHRLRNSLRWRVTGNTVSIGAFVRYARFHQSGTKRGLPARPILPLKNGRVRIPQKWNAAIIRDVERILKTAVNRR